MSPLPVIQDGTRIRRSRMAKWRAAALVGVHLVIAIHIAHWLTAGRTITPVEPSEAMAFAKGGMVNAGLIFFTATILLTAVFGRLFCGWACHLVALQDLCRWLLEKIGIRPLPLRSRLLAWVPALAFVYMFLWPAAYRLWIGDSFDRFGVELTTSEFWATFPGWVIGGLTFLICGFASVTFLGAKGFCTYACPYGAIFSAVEKVSPMRIRVTDACRGCAHCTAVCTSNVRVHEEVRDFGMVVDSGCMKCQDCVSVCPNDALYYGPGPIALLARARSKTATGRPGARKHPLAGWEEAVLAIAFVAAFLTFRGLYGAVPFLMSLGLAGVLAYLVLVAARLAVRPHLALRRFRLKRGGRLLAAGFVFVALMVGVLAFWGHGAYLRAQTYLGDRAYRQTSLLWSSVLDVSAPPRPLAESERDAVRQAITHLETVRQAGLFPTIGNASRLAWLYLLDGSSRKLAGIAGVALARGEDAATIYQLLGRDAWNRGDLAAAVASYRRAIASDAERLDSYLSLGAILGQAGDLAAADSLFVSTLSLFPDSPQLFYNAGLTRALIGDDDRAIDLLDRALALDPKHLEARENLAGVLAHARRFEESVAHYRAALRQAPGDAQTHVLLGRALAAAGRKSAAKTELGKALTLEPENPEAGRLLEDLEQGS